MMQLDHETALSAVRNLNGQELGGRPLRIDLTDSDPFLEGKTTVRGELIDSGETRTQWRERHVEHARRSNDPNAFLANLPPGVPVPPGSTALDTISQVLVTTNPTQILEVLAQMKAFVITHPKQARALLIAHPQLGYALFQALFLNNIIDRAILKRMLQATPQVPPKAPAPYAKSLPMQLQQVFPLSMVVAHTPVQHPTPPIPAQAPMYSPTAAHMPQVQPSPYYGLTPPAQLQSVAQPVPQPAAQTAVPAFGHSERDMLMQVLSLTEAQIISLPPTEREKIQQLRKQFLGTI